MPTPGNYRPFIFSVTLLIPSGRSGNLIWWPAEVYVPHAMSDEEAMDWINQVLTEDGTLRCTKLETEPAAGGSRKIVGRGPTIIGRGAVATVTLPHLEIFDGES